MKVNQTYASRLDYIRALFGQESDAQKSIRASATAMTEDNISLNPEEGRLLQVLARLISAKKIVEIGTFHGYGAMWLADSLVDGGQLWTIEKDTTRAAIARQNLSARSNITLMEGDALAQLTQIAPKGPFDIVFIDADKISYCKYLDWAEQHTRQGGLIIGDNTLLFDAVWHDQPVERVRETARQTMREFNLRLSDSTRYNSFMIGTNEGLTVAQKLF